MIVSLSANKDSVDSVLRLLVALYRAADFNYGPNFLNKAKKWAVEAQPFFEQFKMVRVSKKPLDLLLSGRDVSELPHSTYVKALFDNFKEKKKNIERDLGITKQQLSMMNDLRLAYNGSESAAKRIMANASMLRDSHISKMFLHDDDHVVDTHQRSLYERLQQHVLQYGKVQGVVMPEEVLQKWREEAKKIGSNLPQHQAYLDMRRERKAIYDKVIANIVRSSGQPHMDVSEVRAKMGSVQHDMPAWFVGRIDDKGNYYTVAGRQLMSKPVGEGRMNPKYDPETDNGYVCQYKAPFAQNFTTVTTVDFRTGGRVEK